MSIAKRLARLERAGKPGGPHWVTGLALAGQPLPEDLPRCWCDEAHILIEELVVVAPSEARP
jgi:hypothetical protein